MPEEKPQQDLLRVFLAEQDISCPQCGYNLRTLTGDTCPECGERLALGVHLVEPKQGAPITGLIGLSAGAGFNGLLLLYAFIHWIRFSNPGLGKFIIVNAVGLVVVGSLLIKWLQNWKSIRGRTPVSRWTMAALCWVVSIVDLVIFAMAIR